MTNSLIDWSYYLLQWPIFKQQESPIKALCTTPQPTNQLSQPTNQHPQPKNPFQAETRRTTKLQWAYRLFGGWKNSMSIYHSTTNSQWQLAWTCTCIYYSKCCTQTSDENKAYKAAHLDTSASLGAYCTWNCGLSHWQLLSGRTEPPWNANCSLQVPDN